VGEPVSEVVEPLDGRSMVRRSRLGACGKAPARSGHRVVLYRRAKKNRQNPNGSSLMVWPSLADLFFAATRLRALAMS
jgi:hypothetical protein